MRPLRLAGAGLLALVPLAVGILVLTGGTSTGGDRLAAAVPADGALLDAAPAAVSLRFTGSVDPVRTHVTVATVAGLPVAEGAARVDGHTVVQPVAITGGGGYLVGYHVTFGDGREVSGVSRFTLDGAAPASAARGTEASSDHSHAPTDPLSLAVVCADVVLVGAVLTLILRRPRVR